jgi:hypothetical protein
VCFIVDLLGGICLLLSDIQRDDVRRCSALQMLGSL